MIDMSTLLTGALVYLVAALLTLTFILACLRAGVYADMDEDR